MFYYLHLYYTSLLQYTVAQASFNTHTTCLLANITDVHMWSYSILKPLLIIDQFFVIIKSFFFLFFFKVSEVTGLLT